MYRLTFIFARAKFYTMYLAYIIKNDNGTCTVRSLHEYRDSCVHVSFKRVATKLFLIASGLLFRVFDCLAICVDWELQVD
jgi:hypothetical protein